MLLCGRVLISALQTHNVAMASPIADFVVSLGTDGRVASQGTLSKVLAKDHKLSEEMAEEREELKKADDEVDAVEPDSEDAPKKGDGKLVVAEEISEGQASWACASCLALSRLTGSASRLSSMRTGRVGMSDIALCCTYLC